jgi:hypothetical protein
MASLIILLIIAGCVAYQYLKGTLVRAFATIIIAICASIVAFGYFETLSDMLIGRDKSPDLPAIAPWAQPLCFALLFILTFAILQTALIFLTRKPVDLDVLAERIGRIVCGIFLGLILSGIVLTALAMAPLANKYPYQRFDEINPDAERPSKVLLNTDGFVTGWFGMLSNGSFSAIANKKSFASLHPAFLDQVFLNRHTITDEIKTITSSQAIEVPNENACWHAPEDIEDSDGNPIQRGGYDIIIVRVGIKRAAIRQVGAFTPSQLRLICKPKGDTNRLVGKGINAYPIGYLVAQKQVQKKKLNDEITVKSIDKGEKAKWIDFAFYIREGFVPVLVEFKLNSITELRPPVPAEQAPPVIPFMKETEQDKDTADKNEAPRQPKTSSRERGLSDISKSAVPGLDEDN